jgi:hypothetical protein
MKKNKWVKFLINPALFCYGIFSFIIWDFNIANWHILTRLGYFLFYFLIVYGILKEEMDKK